MSSKTLSKSSRILIELPPGDTLAELGCLRLTDAAVKFGLSRTELFRLCVPEETARVKSHLVKAFPHSRGRRLVEVGSLCQSHKAIELLHIE
jgi:hypothetical protein